MEGMLLDRLQWVGDSRGRGAPESASSAGEGRKTGQCSRVMAVGVVVGGMTAYRTAAGVAIVVVVTLLLLKMFVLLGGTRKDSPGSRKE